MYNPLASTWDVRKAVPLMNELRLPVIGLMLVQPALLWPRDITNTICYSRYKPHMVTHSDTGIHKVHVHRLYVGIYTVCEVWMRYGPKSWKVPPVSYQHLCMELAALLNVCPPISLFHSLKLSTYNTMETFL